MPRPRTYDDELRTRLIDAAAGLLAHEGPHALSVRRIAAEVGTSTNAIYALLGSKDELVRSVYLEGFGRLRDRLLAVPTNTDPLTRLGALGLAYFDSAMADPQLYAVMFNRTVPEFEPTDEDLDFALSTLGVLVDCLADCVAAGVLRGDPDDLAVELWAANHGICTLAIAGMLGPPEAARDHLDRLLGAIGAGYAA